MSGMTPPKGIGWVGCFDFTILEQARECFRSA
jgi:hypothetical protein